MKKKRTYAMLVVGLFSLGGCSGTDGADEDLTGRGDTKDPSIEGSYTAMDAKIGELSTLDLGATPEDGHAQWTRTRVVVCNHNLGMCDPVTETGSYHTITDGTGIRTKHYIHFHGADRSDGHFGRLIDIYNYNLGQTEGGSLATSGLPLELLRVQNDLSTEPLAETFVMTKQSGGGLAGEGEACGGSAANARSCGDGLICKRTTPLCLACTGKCVASCESQGGSCMSDPSDPGFPAICENPGKVKLTGSCGEAVNLACCGAAEASCESLGGHCEPITTTPLPCSATSPLPGGTCPHSGGFGQICCRPGT